MMMTAKRVQDDAAGSRFGALLHALFHDEVWVNGTKTTLENERKTGQEEEEEEPPELADIDASDGEDEESDDFDIPKDDDAGTASETGAAHGEVEETFLALFLAREKLAGADSAWAPWIDVLPTSYPTVLVCWTAAEIASLRDPVLAKEVQQSKNRIEQTYAVLQRLIQAVEGNGDFLFAHPGAFTLELWYWAWLSVQTRSLCFPTGMSEEQLRENFSENPNAADFRPQDLQLALVPFVDMLNHQGGPSPLNFEFHPRPRNEAEQAKWDAEAEERAKLEEEEEQAYENATIGEWEFEMDKKLNPELYARKQRLYADNREQWFTMRAEKPLRKGQQIMFSYGKRPNRDLLFSYGFVLKESVDVRDEFPVPDAWDEIVPVQLPRFVIDRIVKVCGHELAIFKDGGLNAALTQASPVVLLPNCTGWLEGKDSSRLHLFRLFAASEAEARDNVSSRFVRPFSVANELAALRCASDVIDDVINQYSAAPEESQKCQGIHSVRQQLAGLYRSGQRTVLQRHYVRVKLALDLALHGQSSGQFRFPPSSEQEWGRCFTTLCKLAATAFGEGARDRRWVTNEVTSLVGYLRSLPVQ
eukprot:INCI2988.1.p1 GENE.INCI2988.1~~INCI2988.1.p1  ORF type:complete len:587 (+),score=114.29 INCI2988.1:1610-3370(+)